MKAHVCTYKQTELLYYKLSIWVFNCTGLLVGANLPPTNPSVPAVTLSRSLQLIIYICRQIPNMLQTLSNTSLCSMALNWLHSGYISKVLPGLFRDSSRTVTCKRQLNLIKLQTDSILL